MMKRLILSIVTAGIFVAAAEAHHPDRANQPVRMRTDCIGPVGRRLPPGYRRVYNRPSNWEGKIAYWIAPTSQEAIAWHRAKHQRAYECDLPRQERYYFYPKPWESLQIGPRAKAESVGSARMSVDETVPTPPVLSSEMLEAVEAISTGDQPAGDPLSLPDDQPAGDDF